MGVVDEAVETLFLLGNELRLLRETRETISNPLRRHLIREREMTTFKEILQLSRDVRELENHRGKASYIGAIGALQSRLAVVNSDIW